MISQFSLHHTSHLKLSLFSLNLFLVLDIALYQYIIAIDHSSAQFLTMGRDDPFLLLRFCHRYNQTRYRLMHVKRKMKFLWLLNNVTCTLTCGRTRVLILFCSYYTLL